MNPSTTSVRRPLSVILLAAAIVGACSVTTAGDGIRAPVPLATTSSARPAAAVAEALGGSSPGPAAVSSPAADLTPARPTPGTPAPTTAPLPPREAFAESLYHRGAYVAQYTFEWCVGASLQMALHMTGASSDMSRGYQEELWEMARDRSFSPFGGANPRGWTAALNDLGIGPYELVSLPTLDDAVRTAAAAIRATERPVGLVMWRGRHAWVMSGYESVGDPAVHADFAVTGVRVLDPLHPHGSRVWGPSPTPNALISLETLGRQFVRRDSTRVNLGVPPGYLLVLPVVG